MTTPTVVTMTIAWKERHVIPQEPVLSVSDLAGRVRRDFWPGCGERGEHSRQRRQLVQRPCSKGARQCEKVKGGQVAELGGSGLGLRVHGS